MKKLLATFLVSSLLSLNITPVLAMDNMCPSRLKDVDCGYWANSAIETVVNDDIMRVDDCGNFNPDNAITRAEFVTALLKVLSNDN